MLYVTTGNSYSVPKGDLREPGADGLQAAAARRLH